MPAQLFRIDENYGHDMQRFCINHIHTYIHTYMPAQLLRIDENYGYDMQRFFDLAQRIGAFLMHV